jgi:hypothetical protein
MADRTLTLQSTRQHVWADAQPVRQLALSDEQATGASLVEAIRRRFEPFGGVDLELPLRGPGREPPRFE